MTEAIRSYHARRGRLTPSLTEALDRLSPTLDLAGRSGIIDLDSDFGRSAPRILEIGSGLGDTVLAQAQAHPEWDFIAADVHTKGIARTMRTVEELGLANVRVLHGDAVGFLKANLPAESLWQVWIYFPDPWPKSRQQKRRLVTADFGTHLRRVLVDAGTVHLATDDVAYADQMRQTLTPLFEALHDGPRVPDRPVTKYENRGIGLGHTITDFVFRK